MKQWKEWKNKFGIENVLVWNPPGDGNCLFTSMSEALAPRLNYSVKELRYLAAQQVLNEDEDSITKVILPSYCEEYRRGEFVGGWNPLNCKTARDLADAILLPLSSDKGMDFQGDDVILNMLSKILKINIIVLDQEKSSGFTLIGNNDQEEKN